MTVLDGLKAARDLISVPQRWTQGASARNRDGHTCSPLSPEATCFCATGAVRRACHAEVQSDVSEALDMAVAEFGCPYIEDFNDGALTSHRAVLGVFDWAIERIEDADE